MSAFADALRDKRLPAKDLTGFVPQVTEYCAVRDCIAAATATVLVGSTRLPYCFAHEREYVDRYGPADVYALGGAR